MNVKVTVMFREDEHGDVIAVFPYMIYNSGGNCCCYARVGQHSECSWEYVIKNTTPAKEYNDLKRELESIGYSLNNIQRRNYNKYLKEYYKSKES